MAVLNRAAELQQEVSGWRQHLHANPELLFDVHQTAAFVADKLRSFGCDEVVTGIGRTGVVGVIKGANGPGETIGMRADMDALPIKEATDKPYKSTVEGKMHACGHDGHTAMLLGAAKYLAETRNFVGSVAVIFQPAEEGGGGGREMVEAGMMERFGIDRVYGMHNMPQMPVGAFAITHGSLFASTDEFDIVVEGKGGHAAMPHDCVDPIVIGAQIVSAFQLLPSRNVAVGKPIVVSVTKFNAGTAHNIIPETANLAGTVRTMDADVRAFAEQRLRALAEQIAEANGAKVRFRWRQGYPVTVNHAGETEVSVSAAQAISGAQAVTTELPPIMGGEDFAYMLESRPGAMILIGNGDTAGLHHPAYDFNDEIIPLGISYWAKLAEMNPAH